ncbi:MAG: hypothetical protein WBA16_11055 [Nonlabens sp.]
MSILRLLGVLLLCSIACIAYGFYKIESDDPVLGHKFIGFATAFVFLIIMPVFIWLRYKDKDLSKFNLNQNQRQEDQEDNLFKNQDDQTRLN